MDAQLLKGIVEVDETFVGGEMRGKGRGYRGNKTEGVGAMQRGGNICLKVVRGTDRETLHGFSKSLAPSPCALGARRMLRGVGHSA